jgi:hypothetical protein
MCVWWWLEEGSNRQCLPKLPLEKNAKRPDTTSTSRFSAHRVDLRSGDLWGFQPVSSLSRQRERLKRLNGGRTVFRTGLSLLEKGSNGRRREESDNA